MPSRAHSARILFDESHSQAWTIRPEIARAIQPSHPEDSSYALAADALRRRDLEVAVHEAGSLRGAVLEGADVPVLEDPHWAILKSEVDSLRLKQRPDGSVDLGEQDAVELRVQVDAIIAAV